MCNITSTQQINFKIRLAEVSYFAVYVFVRAIWVITATETQPCVCFQQNGICEHLWATEWMNLTCSLVKMKQCQLSKHACYMSKWGMLKPKTAQSYACIIVLYKYISAKNSGIAYFSKWECGILWGNIRTSMDGWIQTM